VVLTAKIEEVDEKKEEKTKEADTMEEVKVDWKKDFIEQHPLAAEAKAPASSGKGEPTDHPGGGTGQDRREGGGREAIECQFFLGLAKLGLL